MTYYLGIDWADQRHDLCLLHPDGRLVSHFTLDHDLRGFQAVAEALMHLDDASIIIQRSDGLLLDWLASLGWSVYSTPPLVLAQRRPRLSKDDRVTLTCWHNPLRMKDPETRPLVLHNQWCKS
jgi:hypothetical protein